MLTVRTRVSCAIADAEEFFRVAARGIKQDWRSLLMTITVVGGLAFLFLSLPD